MSQDVYDTHTIYIYTNNLTEEQIAESIFSGIKVYEKEHNEVIECMFRINMVRNEQNVPLGYCWLYISNPVVYYLLCNHNTDGTERITLVDQENFILPKYTFQEMFDKEYAKEKSKYKEGDWAIDELEEEVKARVQKYFEIPKIEKKLEPLIKPEPMPVNVIDDDTGEVLESKKVIPTISRGKLNYPNERFMFNELKNAHYIQIPNWMDEKFIYGLVRPYITLDRDKRFPKIYFHYKQADGTEEKQIKYVFIRFPHFNTDALAAYTMLRKLTVINPNTHEPYDVAFNFSQVKNKTPVTTNPT